MESTQLAKISYEAIPWEGELQPAVRKAWERLIVANERAPIFSYPEWTEFACQARAITPWRFLIVRRENQPIALFPLYKRTPWTVETISYFSPDHSAAIVDPSAEQEAFIGLATWYAQNPFIQLLMLGPCDNLRHRELFHFACRSCGLATDEHELPSAVIIPMPDSWEEYLAQLGQATRKSVKTAEKRLLRDFPDLRFEILTEPSLASEAALEELMRLYRLRWGNQVGGSFFHHKNNVEFFHKLMWWILEKGFGAIPILRIDGKTVAVSTIFHTPGEPLAIFHLIARELEALPSYYAPGIYINMQSIRWVIERGIRAVNIGSGKNEHKLMLGGKTEPIWEQRVAHSIHALNFTPRIDRALHVTQRMPAHLWYHLQRIKKNDPAEKQEDGEK